MIVILAILDWFYGWFAKKPTFREDVFDIRRMDPNRHWPVVVAWEEYRSEWSPTTYSWEKDGVWITKTGRRLPSYDCHDRLFIKCLDREVELRLKAWKASERATFHAERLWGSDTAATEAAPKVEEEVKKEEGASPLLKLLSD